MIYYIEVYGETRFTRDNASRLARSHTTTKSINNTKAEEEKEMTPPSPTGSASSSGFSSDDEEDEVDQQYERSDSVAVSSVPVDVIEEDDDANTVTPSTFSTSLDGSDETQLQDTDVDALAVHIDAQCMQVARPLLQGLLSFHYEQFTAAIELVTRNWPVGNEDDDDVDDEEKDPKVMAYRTLRAALYARFQKAFPLTPEMYAQWLSDVSERDLHAKQRVFELSTCDYQSVPLALQYAQFLHGNGSEKCYVTL